MHCKWYACYLLGSLGSLVLKCRKSNLDTVKMLDEGDVQCIVEELR